jgi:polar amino acid transport system substrate-binding protein
MKSKFFARAFGVCLVALATLAHAENCANVKSGIGANPKPQNASRDIVGQDLDDIKERGFIEIAAYSDFAPWSYVEDGKVVGVDVEIGKLIASELGVEARFNLLAADENVDADLRNMVIRGPVVGGRVSNIMMHVPYSFEFQCRNEAVVMTGLYHQEQIAIAYRKDAYLDGKLPVPAYFRFDPVGVENDSLADFYLTSLNNGMLLPMITHYPAIEAAVGGLKKAEVKAVMGQLSQLEFLKDQTIGVHTPPLAGLSTGKWSIGVAVRFNWRSLGYAVDDAITAGLEDGRIDAIFKQFGLTHTLAPPQ